MLKKEEIKFKAAVLTKIKRKLEFDNLVLKYLSKGQVLVKINFRVLPLFSFSIF